jgi:hypothetical protein
MNLLLTLILLYLWLLLPADHDAASGDTLRRLFQQACTDGVDPAAPHRPSLRRPTAQRPGVPQPGHARHDP